MRALIERVRGRHRASLRWRLRHDNPRGLTLAQYVAAEQERARTVAEINREEGMPSEFEVLRARVEAARRAYYGPPPSRDQQAAALERQVLAEVSRGHR